MLARSAASPGWGKTATLGGEPASVSITICCSKLSEPEYSTLAPVAASKYASTPSTSSLSGPSHGPKTDTVSPDRSIDFSAS